MCDEDLDALASADFRFDECLDIIYPGDEGAMESSP